MHPSPRPRLADLTTALGLLSRLPVPAGSVAASRMAQAAWAWPLVGALIGALGGAVGSVSLALGLPAAAAAGLALLAQVMATGALHEDGLADTADGFWGGRDPARRLEIMKDSHIGSYGVLALILVTGLRWVALTALAAQGLLPVLIATGALSRLPMVSLARRLPPARAGGLSAATGRPPAAAEALALALALAVGLLTGVSGLLPAVLAGLVVALWLAFAARRMIGGQTGDILGASQQLTDAAILLTLAASLK